jgi:sugar lactone lactonase YvrE
MLGESVVWSVREAALYWIDIRAPAIHRLDPESGEHRICRLPELCGGIAPMASGLVVALRRSLAHFDPDTGVLTVLCEVEPEAAGNRLNEAKCDRSGRLWVGSMRDFAAATSGALYRVDRRLRPERVFGDITIPNSLGWSPDGRTMYFADTQLGALRAYEYDPDTGALGRMRVLLDGDPATGAPDGCAVDAEGHVWTTRFGVGRVLRVAPDGRVSATVQLPTMQPTSCALGGRGLKTLFITTAHQKLDPEQRREQPEAGHLFAVDVDVPGLPDVEFAAPIPPLAATGREGSSRSRPADGGYAAATITA